MTAELREGSGSGTKDTSAGHTGHGLEDRRGGGRLQERTDGSPQNFGSVILVLHLLM